ncbi:SIS domain-containing protein [Streptococcus suis]|nr:SIS domain-containing protein [Streptococcus suis]
MKHQEYFTTIQDQMTTLMEKNDSSIAAAAKAFAQSVKDSGVVHVFGTGHSQMFAMEIFYRAGGLVPVNALLIPHYALFPKAKLSTLQERVEGFSNQYLGLENASEKDSLIIVSISGRNPSAVDMALKAKEMGITVVAVTSLAFSEGVTSRHSSGKLLKDLADVIIDIPCIKGDAVLEMEGMPERFCGTSTVLGMLVMQSMMADTVELLVQAGVKPPVYVSSNLDEGDAINDRLIKQYSHQISCL